MSRRESMAAAGFKITFKCLSLSKRFECDVGFYLPGKKLGSMRNLAGIVFCEAGAEVGCAADVALVGIAEAAEDVGVVHGELVLGVSVGVFLVELVLLFVFVA